MHRELRVTLALLIHVLMAGDGIHFDFELILKVIEQVIPTHRATLEVNPVNVRELSTNCL
jgi:hypothetical protein